MPKGTIDLIPEIFQQVAAWMPRGVTVVSYAPYGGVMRMEIQGDDIEEDASYQMIVTDGPLTRTTELRKNEIGG